MVKIFFADSIEEEFPPTYELRRKRSLVKPAEDFADHVDAITAFDVRGSSCHIYREIE